MAACVVLGSALCGKAAADGMRRRARTIDALCEGIRKLRIHMMSMFEPVQLALGETDFPLFSLVGSGMGNGKSARDAWGSIRDSSTRRGGPADALTEADLKVLDRLFERLGQTGREEQEALLGAALQSAELLREGARKKAGEADRLYLSLGILIGLMLALIVI